MDWPNSGQFGKPRPNACALPGPQDGVASLEEEATLVLQASRDEMATRDHWVWTASLDFQAPKGKRECQETSALGETKDKLELLGLRVPLDLLGPGALLATLGETAPRENKVQRAPRDPQGLRGMTGRQVSLGSLDPQGLRVSQGAWDPEEKAVWTVLRDQRGSPATEAPLEPQGPGVRQASRASKETQW